MKIIFSCFAAALLFGLTFAVPTATPDLEGAFEDIVNNTINKFLANLSDPISMAKLDLDLNQTFLNGTLNITALSLSGIKQLVATKLNVSMADVSLQATILIPQLGLNTKYNMNLLVAELVPLYGSGHIGVDLEDIELSIGGKLVSNSISNVTVAISIKDAVFDLHGLLDNEELSVLISEVLNDNFVKFLDENADFVGNLVAEIVTEIINGLLNGQEDSVEMNQFWKNLNSLH